MGGKAQSVHVTFNGQDITISKEFKIAAIFKMEYFETFAVLGHYLGMTQELIECFFIQNPAATAIKKQHYLILRTFMGLAEQYEEM